MSIIKVDYGDVASGGGITTIDYNYVKNIVTTNGANYTFTPYNSRCTVNEGGIYFDSTNKLVYIYIDITLLVNTSTEYYLASTTPTGGTSLLPQTSTTAMAYNTYLIALSEAIGQTANPKMFIRSLNSDIMVCAYNACKSGDRFKIYGMYIMTKE